jgi:alpha-tubulin suppressor-like RCC1 family protein
LVEAAANVSDVALTNDNLYYVSNGDLYTWVNGLGVKVTSPGKVIEIVAGDRHLVALLEDKSIAVLGTNSSGQLGLGTDALGKTFTALTKLPLTNVAHIAAGAETTIVLLADGTVKVFGLNSRGELGLNSKINQVEPVSVPNISDVADVSASKMATFLLMKDGTVKASGFHDWINGSVYTTNTSFVTLPGLTSVTQLFAGGETNFATLVGQAPNVLRGWGGNNSGKIGDGTFTERHNLSYSFFTQYPAYVPPVVTVNNNTTVSPFTVYTSMNQCLKANPTWKGKDCNALLEPHLRGQDNIGPWSCISVANGGDAVNKNSSDKCSKEEQGDKPGNGNKK